MLLTRQQLKQLEQLSLQFSQGNIQQSHLEQLNHLLQLVIKKVPALHQQQPLNLHQLEPK
jgi:hypothetical protein